MEILGTSSAAMNHLTNPAMDGPNGTASLLFPSVVVWVFIVICITSLLTCLLTAIYLLLLPVYPLLCVPRWLYGGWVVVHGKALFRR